MSNVSLKERIAIDKRKLAGKEKRKTDLLFALEQVEAEIRYLNDRIRYNEKRAKEREEREAEIPCSLSLRNGNRNSGKSRRIKSPCFF